MPALGPVFHILGLILLALGVAMTVPAGLDLALGDPNWPQVLEAAIETSLAGALLALASRVEKQRPFDLRQAYLLTAGIWVVVPFFAALPFLYGRPDASLTDAYFEAVSGITTTGYTVFTGLDNLPRSVVLWRGMLNWMGGLGIAFVAMIFLPVMRVGGMRFFQTEGFDTLGKVLPRARDIARELLRVYMLLTALCAVIYMMLGMPALDALVHAMATIATGGFGTTDASFSGWSNGAQYAGAIFMLASALPFIRYVQLLRGTPRAILRDPQVAAFLRWFGWVFASVSAWRLLHDTAPAEQILRETLFNYASIMTGTGFFSANVESWGTFPLAAAFCAGMIGGCTGSSSGALSVFRWQALAAAIVTAVRRLHAPHRVILPRYAGKILDSDTLDPLMFYFTGYILTLGVLSVGVSMTGIDMQSALFAVWAAVGNIGFGFGPMVARTGTMVDFNDTAIWLLTLAMLLGRLGLLAILVVFLPRFWRS